MPVGAYHLSVEWRALKSLPDGEPFKAEPLKEAAAFEVTEK